MKKWKKIARFIDDNLDDEKLKLNQRNVIKYIENNNISLIFKDRQVGFTTLVKLYTVYNLIYNKQNSLIIVHDIRAMEQFRDFVVNILEKYDIDFNAYRDKIIIKKYHGIFFEINNSNIISTRFNNIIIDDSDYIKNLKAIILKIYPYLCSSKGKLIMSIDNIHCEIVKQLLTKHGATFLLNT